MHKIQHAPSRFNSLNAALIVPQTLVRKKKMKGRRLLCFCISIAPLVLIGFQTLPSCCWGDGSACCSCTVWALSSSCSLCQWRQLDFKPQFWKGVSATGWESLVDARFASSLPFPEIEGRGKRWKQRGVKRWWETRGAAILRFLVSSCFLLSRLVKLVMAFLCSLLLRNLSLPAEHFAN